MNESETVAIIRRAAYSVGGNFRRYKYRVCDPINGGNSKLGLSDFQPVEGKVIAIEEDVVVVQEGRKAVFVAFDLNNLDQVPSVGDKVKVTPYQRRRFDGKRLSDPVEEKHENGFVSKVYHLGEQASKIPGITADASQYLQDMAEQLANLPADSRRRITQVLIDAGAWKKPVQTFDVTEDTDTHLLPKLVFHIEQENQKGTLSVTLDRAADAYVVALEEDGKEPVIREDCYFDDLGSVINELIVHNDDWLKDRVEIIKKAAKKKAS